MDRSGRGRVYEEEERVYRDDNGREWRGGERRWEGRERSVSEGGVDVFEEQGERRRERSRRRIVEGMLGK